MCTKALMAGLAKDISVVRINILLNCDLFEIYTLQLNCIHPQSISYPEMHSTKTL